MPLALSRGERGKDVLAVVHRERGDITRPIAKTPQQELERGTGLTVLHEGFQVVIDRFEPVQGCDASAVGSEALAGGRHDVQQPVPMGGNVAIKALAYPPGKRRATAASRDRHD